MVENLLIQLKVCTFGACLQLCGWHLSYITLPHPRRTRHLNIVKYEKM